MTGRGSAGAARLRALLFLLLLLLAAGGLRAEPPERSLRPQLRPGEVPLVVVPERQLTVTTIEARGLARSLRPQARPRAVERAAAQEVAARARGQVCGDPALQGARVAAISGRMAGCGVAAPIRLTSVAGVALSRPAIMDCPTAAALKTWVNRGVKPAVGAAGGGVARLDVAAHYACRTRNNQPGARISEHGKGRAIDISAVGLRDGSEINVLRDWGRGARGQALREMWRAACGPFGTVLGPNADRFHRDHFHFDTARHRSGAYCR